LALQAQGITRCKQFESFKSARLRRTRDFAATGRRPYSQASDARERTMRLQGKVAIVTGAGGGIGAAICRRFAAEGAALIGVDVDAAALASMATSVCAGARVATLVADVAEEAAAEAAVARAGGEFGGLDVLVSNAVCDVPLAPLTRLTLADWRRTMAVNLDAAFLFCKHAIPAMEAGGGGSIILIASQLGRVARPGRPWYCAAKGALIQLAKAMALDHAGQNIRVNSLSPGPVETARYLRNFDTLEAARASHHTLVGRLGSPDEIAAGAVYLAGEDSTFVTGADLLIDGGYTAV
jgi:NAD(P)-dependent dehydrogenase (short-subunit alcohol dehydrogenase family)